MAPGKVVENKVTPCSLQQALQVVLVLVAILLASSGSSAGGLGSKHDALERGGTDPDRMTEVCLNCHDGSVSQRLTNHPVGMNYRRYLTRFPQDYNSLKGRYDQVTLVNGKVSCISCHELKNSELSRQVVAKNIFETPEYCRAGGKLNSPNGVTGLCQSCHIR